jgi:hypothetical protein
VAQQATAAVGFSQTSERSFLLEKTPKYRNHTRNHIKLTYLRNTQKINCLKRPKFREKNDLIELNELGRNDLR